MATQLLHSRLSAWIALAEANGIKQHDPRWLEAKIGTVGGSSMATLAGHNPFSTEARMITDKVGLTKFQPDIKPQWGNLFEDVIKRYVEADLRCEVLGEDLYVDGPAGTAYSPDGLAVLTDPATGEPTIALLEFKCPYVRIPTGSVPKHYVPQLLMGLDLFGSDLLDEDGQPCDVERAVTGCAHGAITDRAMFAEAVFRRCAWTDCGPGSTYNDDLVKRTGARPGAAPLAFGINGFYMAGGGDAIPPALLESYLDEYCELGDASNDFQSADLGESPPALFTAIMSAYDRGILRAWYGPVRRPGVDTAGALTTAYVADLQADLDAFDAFCAEHNHTNWGILPWKMFRIDYHWVSREAGYVAPVLPKIRALLSVVTAARACPERAQNIIDAYTCSGGFSDD